jgi:hypothetical protein
MAKFSQSGAQGRERARASFYNTTALGLCMACALTLSPGLAHAGGALAYATAAVSASSAANAGGFVGQNGGSISFAYATGPVQGGGASTGGFVGNNFSTGTIFAGYWDAQTTMQGAAIGNDQNAQSGNVMDLTTVELQSGLPLNFVGSIWGSDPTINDGLPYLLQLTDSY